MPIEMEMPYNAHFELSPAGHVALARSCGGGWWEEWVRVGDQDWRRVAELLLNGRNPIRVGDSGNRGREKARR